MPEDTIYLDYAAGTPVAGAVLAAGLAAAEREWGNPSALHAAGEDAAAKLAEARGSLAKLLAVKPASLVFTAGATEANNLLFLALRETYPDRNHCGLGHRPRFPAPQRRLPLGRRCPDRPAVSRFNQPLAGRNLLSEFGRDQ